MAAPIVVSAPINAPPERIFEALTQSVGQASFWIEDRRAKPTVGSVNRLRLPSGYELELRVDRLEAARLVVWSALTTIARPPTWRGTRVTWDLQDTGDGTTGVVIEHGGWPDEMPQTELGELTFLWASVLRSLKPTPREASRGRSFPPRRGPTCKGGAAMANPVLWFEVLGRDGPRLRQFYAELFGWKIGAGGAAAGHDYALVEPGYGGIVGGIGAESDSRAGHATFFVEVESPQRVLAHATRLGGRIVAPAATVEPLNLEVAWTKDAACFVCTFWNGQLQWHHRPPEPP
jgi:uncharacterized protein